MYKMPLTSYHILHIINEIIPKEDECMGKLVVVVQCHLIMNRCSGYNCMNFFYQKQGVFCGA